MEQTDGGSARSAPPAAFCGPRLERDVSSYSYFEEAAVPFLFWQIHCFCCYVLVHILLQWFSLVLRCTRRKSSNGTKNVDQRWIVAGDAQFQTPHE